MLPGENEMLACVARPTLRILTYNIRHGTDFLGRDTLTGQARVIRDSRADIVLLQEVDRGTRRRAGEDIASRLAELSGLPHSAFGANEEIDDGEFGNALLSRLPLFDVLNHSIPGPTPSRSSRRFRRGPRERRGILEAVVRYAGADVRLLCTHFGYLPGEPAAGARAALRIIEADARPLIVGGDLNRPVARSRCHRLLRSALVECRPPHARLPATFPAPWPRVRLDYLYGRGVAAERAGVFSVTASDHRPLVADVAVRGDDQRPS